MILTVLRTLYHTEYMKLVNAYDKNEQYILKVLDDCSTFKLLHYDNIKSRTLKVIREDEDLIVLTDNKIKLYIMYYEMILNEVCLIAKITDKDDKNEKFFYVPYSSLPQKLKLRRKLKEKPVIKTPIEGIRHRGNANPSISMYE